MKQALALLALLAAAPAAGQGARGQATVLMSETPGGRQAQEKWGYNDALVVGDTVYLSGVVAGKGPDEAGLEPAYERVYRHIAATLKRAGVSWDDVVDMTTYHTDANAQIDSFAKVKKRYIKAPHPAWTAVQVAGLLGQRGITEIKIVAKRPASPKANR